MKGLGKACWLVLVLGHILDLTSYAQDKDEEFIIEVSDPVLLSTKYSNCLMPIYRNDGTKLTDDLANSLFYPEFAKQYKNSGLVKVSFKVDEEGKVSKVRTIEGTADVFKTASKNGVEKAIKSFDTPAIFEGIPVSVYLSIDITFRVEGMPFGSCVHAVAYDLAKAGMEDLKSGNYRSAIENLTASIESDSNHYETFVERAKAYRKTGNPLKAIEDLKKSLAMVNHERSETLGMLGSVYLDLGNKGEALKFLNQCLELNSKDYLALVDIGKIHLENSEFDNAEHFFKKAKKQHHTPTKANFYLGLLELIKGDYKSGLKSFSKVLIEEPENGQAYFHRGMCQARLRNTESACEDWVKAQSLGVKDAELLVQSQCSGNSD